MVAIVVSFHPSGMTKAKYDKAIEALEAAGVWPPEGQLSHACYGEDGDLQVVDIYDSHEAFDAFGKTLMPILDTVGIIAGRPEISEVHSCLSVDCQMLR